jgi:hypothetical protein
MFEPIDRVMKMRRGDSAVPRRTQIAGQDHMLSYITPQEAGILQLLGGSGRPGPAGIPAFDGHVGGADPDSGPGGFGGGFDSDDRGGPDDDFDPLEGTVTRDASTGARTSFTATPGTGDYGGYEDDFFSLDQPATSGGGVLTPEASFRSAESITDRNPYGRRGFFTRVFGIDPRKIDYTSNLSPRARAQIAGNQFSKFANPQNIRGRLGFNPAFPDASVETPGRLRAGLQSGLLPRSFETAYGPTATYNVKRSPMDTAALLAMPTGLGILADQLSNKTAGFDPSAQFTEATQNLGALTGGQATPGFRPADATESGDFSPFGSLTQGINQGIGALEDVVGGIFTGAGDFFNTLDPEQGRRARAAAQAQQAQTQTFVPKERSVFDNFKTNIMKIPETIEDLFTPAPVVSTSSLDFMPRGASLDLAGFESRFAPAPAIAPETQQELDAFSMGLPGVQATPTVTSEFLTGTSADFSPAQRDAINAAGNAAFEEATRSGRNATAARIRAENEAKIDALRSNQQSSTEVEQQSSVSPDLFGVSRRQVATVPAGQFFSENPEALAAIDSDAVRSAVMDPGTRQGFFVDDVTGEISRELPGGSGIRAVVGQIPGMEAPVDFSLPSLSDLAEGIAGIGSTIRGLGSNPLRAEAERRRQTTSGNVFRPST